MMIRLWTIMAIATTCCLAGAAHALPRTFIFDGQVTESWEIFEAPPPNPGIWRPYAGVPIGAPLLFHVTSDAEAATFHETYPGLDGKGNVQQFITPQSWKIEIDLPNTGLFNLTLNTSTCTFYDSIIEDKAEFMVNASDENIETGFLIDELITGSASDCASQIENAPNPNLEFQVANFGFERRGPAEGVPADLFDLPIPTGDLAALSAVADETFLLLILENSLFLTDPSESRIVLILATLTDVREVRVPAPASLFVPGFVLLLAAGRRNRRSIGAKQPTQVLK